MSQRFEDKAFGSVGIEANRNRSNEFLKKDTQKPTKPDETQDTEVTREITVLVNGKRYAILDDGDLEIRNKLNGMGISIQQNGDIMMLSGSGDNGKACGGRFIINAKGGQLAKYQGPVITEASANPASSENGDGSDTSETSSKDKIACSNLYYGDAITECHGELRIKATKIVIEAADVLSLIGKSKVLIQAGPNGGGSIQFNAGKITTNADSVENQITGQKTEISSESTDIQFDPRSSKNIMSTGHINWKILGDYQQTVSGVSNLVSVGGVVVPPLVEDRTTGFSVTTLSGGLYLKSAALFDIFAGGDATFTATDTSFDTANFSVDAAAVDITGAGDVSINSTTNIRITGALIYLN